jgi:cytoskeletal protein RodZ
MKLNDGAPVDLTTVRRKKGVSLEDISKATKIGMDYLLAIENGDFARLPGGIYSTSFIRQYACAIDYSESELLDHYYRTIGLLPDGGRAEQPGPPKKKSFFDLLRPVTRVFS